MNNYLLHVEDNLTEIKLVRKSVHPLGLSHKCVSRCTEHRMLKKNATGGVEVTHTYCNINTTD